MTILTEEKKMPNHQQFSHTYNNYVPAILCHQKDNWQIEYYVYSPVTNQMERKRIRLNKLRRHCRTLQEFKVQASNIIQTINNQLAGGWSPFGESENIRYYTTLDEVMRLYIEEKQKELKPDTLRSYKSFCRIFGEWCLNTIPGCKCIQFNRVLAIRYMDYVYNERKVSARGYNNQLKMARALFSWAVEKCYCKENPFETIRVKKEAEKKRVVIDADTRRRIREYFEEVNPGYIVVMELIYTSFLRPAEVSRVQISQIDLQEHCIYMSADKTKNGKRRAAPLSAELCERIAEQIEGKPVDWYLIGYGFKPGQTALSRKMYGKEWIKMRKALDLPDTMQLYSLRDSGFFDKLKAGIPALTVMQAADHHDLTMTTRYANHADPGMIDAIRNLSPDF